MLDIVPNWNPVQYQGKLIMQTWENGEKTISGLILAISEKTNDRRISRKFSGGGTDGQTDRQTDRQMDRQTKVIS